MSEHSVENDARAALAYLVSMAQGHDYADGYKISTAEDVLLDALDRPIPPEGGDPR